MLVIEAPFGASLTVTSDSRHGLSALWRFAGFRLSLHCIRLICRFMARMVPSHFIALLCFHMACFLRWWPVCLLDIGHVPLAVFVSALLGVSSRFGLMNGSWVQRLFVDHRVSFVSVPVS